MDSLIYNISIVLWITSILVCIQGIEYAKEMNDLSGQILFIGLLMYALYRLYKLPYYY